MKLVAFIFVFFLSSSIQSQSVQFATEMTSAVKAFDVANTAKDYQAVLFKLDPISKAYANEWLPLYYMSLIKTRMSMLKMGNSDELANQSIDLLEKSKKIQVNDEILCAESLAYTAKMTVSPYTRWLRYEHKIKSPLVQAKRINKDNPRIYALEASLQYHMPLVFGGGCSKSYPIALVAAEKLTNQNKLSTVYYMPHWGINIIKEITDNCK
jgi:hypothetical protein